MTSRELEIFRKFIKKVTSKQILAEILHVMMDQMPEWKRAGIIEAMEEYYNE